MNDIRPRKVVVKDGDSYRETDFYYREDLAAMGEKYSECAFNIQIENELLRNANKIEFWVITENNEIYKSYSIEVDN